MLLGSPMDPQQAPVQEHQIVANMVELLAKRFKKQGGGLDAKSSPSGQDLCECDQGRRLFCVWQGAREELLVGSGLP